MAMHESRACDGCGNKFWTTVEEDEKTCSACKAKVEQEIRAAMDSFDGDVADEWYLNRVAFERFYREEWKP